MNEKTSFILYSDYWQHLEILTDEERGRLITAIFAYVRTGEVIEISGGAKMAFSFIRSQIDRDTQKWEEVKNARSEAGKKGAEARWNGKA